MTHTPSLTAQGSAQSYLPVSTSAASIPPDTGAAAFSQIRARVNNLQRQVDAMKPQGGKPAKRGFYEKLDRLRDAKTALLHAENKLNRN